MDAVLADATMVVHFAYLVFVVLGGFLAWRWTWVIVPHVCAAGWAALIVAFSWNCPLTPVENHFRAEAGQNRLGAEGFVGTYLTDVVYPEEYVWLAQLGLALAVVVSWAVLGVRWARGQTSEAAR